MARTCAFCGATPLCNEHVLPRWLHVAFPSATNRALHVRQSLTNEHAREGGLLDTKAKIVCENCNSGWMNRLESGVRDFLPKMIRGKQTRLGARRQAALAAWCVKTAMMFQCTHPKVDQQAIPAEDYAAFFHDRQPNPMTTVWAGYLEVIPRPRADVDSAVEFIGQPLQRNDSVETEDGTETISGRGFVATLRLGHLITQVTRIGPAEFPMQLTPVALRPHLARLWPAEGVRKWPPLAIEGVGGFQVLANALLADDPMSSGPVSL